VPAEPGIDGLHGQSLCNESRRCRWEIVFTVSAPRIGILQRVRLTRRRRASRRKGLLFNADGKTKMAQCAAARLGYAWSNCTNGVRASPTTSHWLSIGSSSSRIRLESISIRYSHRRERRCRRLRL